MRRSAGQLPQQEISTTATGRRADLFEVASALRKELGISEAALKEVADHKRATKGGFTQRIWLEHVDG